MKQKEALTIESGDILFANRLTKQFVLNEKFIVGERIDDTCWRAKSMMTGRILIIDAYYFETKPVANEHE